MKNKFLLPLLLAPLVLSGCDLSITKPYDPYRDREETSNNYNGTGDEFHLSSWYASDYGLITIEEEEGETKVNYSKDTNFEYTYMFTSVTGRFADFSYINILAKGTPGKSIAFRLCYDNVDLENSNCLGNDTSFSLNEEYSIHTLKVKGTMKNRMDLLTRVCIFPEIGLSGISVMGEFYFKDVWFSKTMPENAKLENPGVDTGDTTSNVNGWTTQAWTGYTLYSLGNNKTGLKYSSAAEWAFTEKNIEINEGDNGLRFVFENKISSKKLSISNIHFLLRGDVASHVSEGVEYEYDIYYEGAIYTYDITKDNEVEPDENNIVTLELPLESALNKIGNHHENGYRLTLLIESHPEDYDTYRKQKDGEMVIMETSTFKSEFEIDEYTQEGLNTYTITKAEGVERNITYTDVRGDAYYPRITRTVSMNVGQTVTLTFRNNGENSVRIGVHAGKISDERSDTLNNLFFPLFKNQGKDEDGYFRDGETIDILPGETQSVVASVDSQFEGEVFTAIQLLIDNCYGDQVKRSGNIDIVSVVIE